MVSSRAPTVEQYLDELPEDRRQVVSTVRTMLLKYLPRGYVETMNWGMICYEIPLAKYPKTYNGQPLAVAALAAQKNYYSLYGMYLYADTSHEQKLREIFNQAGKKLNMGKCCIRFKKLDDIPLEAICKLLKPVTAAKYIASYEAAQAKKK